MFDAKVFKELFRGPGTKLFSLICFEIDGSTELADPQFVGGFGDGSNLLGGKGN